MSMTIEQLNRMGQADFIRALSPVLEHAPWAAEAAWSRRPFAGPDQLHSALCAALRSAGEPAQIALIRAQPDLAGRTMRTGRFSTDMLTDKVPPALNQLSVVEVEDLQKKNGEYRYKFGFPFVISASQRDKTEIFAELERRLKQTREQELAEALKEIGHLISLRLTDLLIGMGTSAQLTVQVLDQVSGGPAEGIVVELWSVPADNSVLVASRKTNSTGRTDPPLIDAPNLKPGNFIIQAFVGDYFAVRASGKQFIERIQVPFTVTDTNRSWHLILACSPAGYSFGRGA